MCGRSGEDTNPSQLQPPSTWHLSLPHSSEQLKGKCYLNIVKVRAVRCHLVNCWPWGQIQVLSLNLSWPLYSADLLVLGCVIWRPVEKAESKGFLGFSTVFSSRQRVTTLRMQCFGACMGGKAGGDYMSMSPPLSTEHAQ